MAFNEKDKKKIQQALNGMNNVQLQQAIDTSGVNNKAYSSYLDKHPEAVPVVHTRADGSTYLGNLKEGVTHGDPNSLGYKYGQNSGNDVFQYDFSILNQKNPYDPYAASAKSAVKKALSQLTPNGKTSMTDTTSPYLTPDQVAKQKEDKAKQNAAYTNDAYFRELQKESIWTRYKQDPKSVTPNELAFAQDQIPFIPKDQYDNTKSGSYYAQKNKQDIQNKTSAIESQDKKALMDHGVLTYDPSLGKDFFNQDKSNYYANTNLDGMSQKDIQNLKDAKANGKKNAIVDFNGKKISIPIDQAINVGSSFWSQVGFNNQHKGIWDNIKGKAGYALSRAMDAMMAPKNVIEGSYDAFHKSTGIDALKLAKPFINDSGELLNNAKDIGKIALDAGLAGMPYQKPHQYGVNDLHKSWNDLSFVGNKNTLTNQQAAQTNQEASQAWKDQFQKTKNNLVGQYNQGGIGNVLGQYAKKSLNVDTNVGKEALGQLWKSVNGQYTSRPGDAPSAYKSLTKEGFDPNSTNTKAIAGATDIATSMMNPFSFGGVSVVGKGGKLLDNSPKAIKALEDTFRSRIGSSQFDNPASPVGQMARNVFETLKNGGSVTNQEMDQLFNTTKQTAFDAKNPYRVGQGVMKSDLLNTKARLLDNRFTNFKGNPVPIVGMGKRATNAIDKAQTVYDQTASKLPQYTNHWEDVLKNVYKEASQHPSSELEQQLRNIYSSQAGKNHPSFDEMLNLATKSPKDIQNLLAQNKTLKAYGLPKGSYTEPIPTGDGIQHLNVNFVDNPAKQQAFSNLQTQKMVGSQSRINNIVNATNKTMAKDPTTIDQLYADAQKAQMKADRQVQKEARWQGKFNQKFDNNVKPWHGILKDSALGPISYQKGINFMGNEVVSRNALAKLADKTGLSYANKLVNKIPAVQKFNSVFNQNKGANVYHLNRLKDAEGQTNFEQLQQTQKLNQLLKGSTQKDLEKLTAYMVRPNEVIPNNVRNLPDHLKGQTATLPDVFKQNATINGVTKPIIDHLKDFSKQSFTRENQLRQDMKLGKDMKYLEHYLTASYKNPEKQVEDLLGQGYVTKGKANHYQEKKVFKDMIHAMQAKPELKAEMNAGTLLNQREKDSIDWANRQVLKKQFDTMKNQAPDVFNEATQKAFDRYINPENYRSARGLIGTKLKGVNDWWKVATMNTLPATALRNLYGGIINNFEDQVGLSHYARGGKVALADTLQHASNVLSDITKGKIKPLNTDNWKLAIHGEKNPMTLKDFREKAIKGGINQGLMNGMTTHERFGKATLGQKLNPFNKNEFIGFAPGKAMNQNVEKTLRNANFIKGLDQYGLKGTKEAAQNVRKVQFDYSPSGLSRGEKWIQDYLVPFYTFQKHNLPYQATKIMENPNRFNLVGNSIQQATDQFDPNHNDPTRPDYSKYYWYTGSTGKGKTSTYLPTNFNAAYDFKDWFDPAQKAQNMVAPWIKGLYDAIPDTKKTMQGMDITGTRQSMLGDATSGFLHNVAPTFSQNVLGIDGSKNKNGHYVQNAKNEQVLKDLLPLSSNISNFVNAVDNHTQNGQLDVKNLLKEPKVYTDVTGLAPTTMDYGRNQSFALKNASDALDSIMKALKIKPNPNYSPYDTSKPNQYTVDEQYNKALQDLQNPKYPGYKTSKMVSVDGYPMSGINVTKDPWGKIASYQYTKPAKTAFQQKQRADFEQQAQMDMAQHDWFVKHLKALQDGTFTLKNFYQENHLPYPYTNAWQKAIQKEKSLLPVNWKDQMKIQGL